MNVETVPLILANGFRDSEGMYLTNRKWRGVWVSDRDLEEHILEAPALLTFDVPAEVLAEYEWVQEDLGYREFLVPATVLNMFGPPTPVDSSDEPLKIVRRSMTSVVSNTTDRVTGVVPDEQQ
jgi:hypothetical protein